MLGRVDSDAVDRGRVPMREVMTGGVMLQGLLRERVDHPSPAAAAPAGSDDLGLEELAVDSGHDGARTYDTLVEAERRLRQIEFKHARSRMASRGQRKPSA